MVFVACCCRKNCSSLAFPSEGQGRAYGEGWSEGRRVYQQTPRGVVIRGISESFSLQKERKCVAGLLAPGQPAIDCLLQPHATKPSLPVGMVSGNRVKVPCIIMLQCSSTYHHTINNQFSKTLIRKQGSKWHWRNIIYHTEDVYSVSFAALFSYWSLREVIVYGNYGVMIGGAWWYKVLLPYGGTLGNDDNELEK